MCGIAGAVGIRDRAVVSRMIAALTHRGPDDEGLFADPSGEAVLGHTRLSIIDLSSAGHQPMCDSSGQYWISFNGEIYNHRVLRTELERLGRRFRSASDTEVVLAAYAEWGSDCLRRLRGMFAFAIWDCGTRDGAISPGLFLARDRLGIKPLLYAETDGGLVFASELGALLASGLIEPAVAPQVLWDYLAFGSVPQPRTMLRAVRALPAGACAVYRRDGGLGVRRWWDLADISLNRETAAMPRSELVRALRERLEEAARAHLVADVPVGAFLSGGVDSSAVVGLLSRVSSAPLRTFSIGLEPDNASLDELHYARLVAVRHGTVHTEQIFTAADCGSLYDSLVEAIDQPSVDGVNAYLVSKLASEQVKVCVSGVGGDELFGGYDLFGVYIEASRWDGLGLGPAIRLAHYLDSLMLRRHLSRIAYQASAPETRLAHARRQLSDAELRGVLAPLLKRGFEPLPADRVYRDFVRPSLAPFNQVSYSEMGRYLCDTLLRDCDAMSMAHGLEIRPLLIDHTLVEFVFAISGKQKFVQGRPKALFVDAVRDLVPAECIARPKVGFVIPIWHLLASSLRSRAREVIESSEARQWLSAPGRERCVAMLGGGEVPRPWLWSVVVLIEWLRRTRARVLEPGQ